jgi:flagellar hook protein FlgE
MQISAMNAAIGGMLRNQRSVDQTAHNIANVNTEGEDVELAEEMTDLIVGQRGFEANGASVRTADEMLQELLLLKR